MNVQRVVGGLGGLVLFASVGCVASDGTIGESGEGMVGESESALTQTLGTPAARTLTICQSYRSAEWSHGMSNSGWPFDIGLSAYCPGNEAAGVPLIAMADGTVSHLRPSPASQADDHMNLFVAGGGLIMYGHVIPSSSVWEGKAVKKGEVIATIRPAGWSNGNQAHVHLEVYAGNCWMCSPQPFTGAYRMGTNDFPGITTSNYFRGYTIKPQVSRRGDVTGDGRADLVSVAGGNAYVWPGLANGGFGGAVASFSGTLDSGMLDGSGHAIKGVVDVTGDGRADLVSTASGSAYVWPGLATGGFGGAVASFSGSLSSANRIVGVADVNGDGRADLVSTMYGTAYVWPGQSNGAFGAYTASFSGTLGSSVLIVGVSDVTGDGRADLVGRSSGSIFVWPGLSNAGFGGAVSSFSGTLDSTHHIVDVSDVNGDGRADLVSINSNGSAYVWPGTSSGAFGGAVASFGGTLNASNVDGTGHFIVGVADITGDGKGDLLSVSPDGNAYVWPGLSSGAFGAAVSSFNGTLNTSNKDRDGGHYIVGPSGRVL